jgi:hypothetical protein
MTHPLAKHWTPNDSVCELCGQQFAENIPEADMWHPRYEEHGSLIVHKACGEQRGMEYA